MQGITPRAINDKLKQGWDLRMFSERYKISEEKFLDFLYKTYGKKASEAMTKELKRNGRRNSRRKGKDGANEIDIQQDEIQLNQIGSENIEEIQIAETMIEHEEIMEIEEEVEIQESDGNESFLKELSEKAEKTRSEICKVEAERERYCSRKKELKKQLREANDKLLSLQKLVEENDQKVADITNELYELNDSIEELNVQISSGKKELTSIEHEIKELQKLTIYVYENGNIEAENEIDKNVEVVIPDSWEEIYKEIRENEVVEDITVKQVKLFAQLIAFVNTLENYEISFGIDGFEEIFKSLKN